MQWFSRYKLISPVLRKSFLAMGLLVGGFSAEVCLAQSGGHPVKADHYQPPVMPEPPGAFVRRFQAVQTDKAEASDFVFFLDEWYQGGDKLGPFGQYHLTQVAQRLPSVPFPVVIQPHSDPNLNETRRQVVVTGLTNLGIPDADVRVVIAYPQAEGLRFKQIELVNQNLLFQQAVNNRIGAFRGTGFGRGFNRFGLGFGGFGRVGFGGFGGVGGFGGFRGGAARPLIYGS